MAQKGWRGLQVGIVVFAVVALVFGFCLIIPGVKVSNFKYFSLLFLFIFRKAFSYIIFMKNTLISLSAIHEWPGLSLNSPLSQSLSLLLHEDLLFRFQNSRLLLRRPIGRMPPPPPSILFLSYSLNLSLPHPLPHPSLPYYPDVCCESPSPCRRNVPSFYVPLRHQRGERIIHHESQRKGCYIRDRICQVRG